MHPNIVGLNFPCSWKILRVNKASIRGSKGHEQVFFFASELLLAKIYCAMNECLVCSFLSMPSLYFHLYPYLFLFYSTCSFSILLFLLCVWFGCSYIHLCAFWCVCVFFVWIWSAWLRWQLLLLHWACHQKGSYQQVSPTPTQRLNGLRRLDMVPAVL